MPQWHMKWIMHLTTCFYVRARMQVVQTPGTGPGGSADVSALWPSSTSHGPVPGWGGALPIDAPAHRESQQRRPLPHRRRRPHHHHRHHHTTACGSPRSGQHGLAEAHVSVPEVTTPPSPPAFLPLSAPAVSSSPQPSPMNPFGSPPAAAAATASTTSPHLPAASITAAASPRPRLPPPPLPSAATTTANSPPAPPRLLSTGPSVQPPPLPSASSVPAAAAAHGRSPHLAVPTWGASPFPPSPGSADGSPGARLAAVSLGEIFLGSTAPPQPAVDHTASSSFSARRPSPPPPLPSAASTSSTAMTREVPTPLGAPLPGTLAQARITTRQAIPRPPGPALPGSDGDAPPAVLLPVRQGSSGGNLENLIARAISATLVGPNPPLAASPGISQHSASLPSALAASAASQGTVAPVSVAMPPPAPPPPPPPAPSQPPQPPSPLPPRSPLPWQQQAPSNNTGGGGGGGAEEDVEENAAHDEGGSSASEDADGAESEHPNEFGGEGEEEEFDYDDEDAVRFAPHGWDDGRSTVCVHAVAISLGEQAGGRGGGAVSRRGDHFQPAGNREVIERGTWSYLLRSRSQLSCDIAFSLPSPRRATHSFAQRLRPCTRTPSSWACASSSGVVGFANKRAGRASCIAKKFSWSGARTRASHCRANPE